MNRSVAIIAFALSALVVGAAMAQAPPASTHRVTTAEKCCGVSMAGKNDCAACPGIARTGSLIQG